MDERYYVLNLKIMNRSGSLEKNECCQFTIMVVHEFIVYFNPLEAHCEIGLVIPKN